MLWRKHKPLMHGIIFCFNKTLKITSFVLPAHFIHTHLSFGVPAFHTTISCNLSIQSFLPPQTSHTPKNSDLHDKESTTVFCRVREERGRSTTDSSELLEDSSVLESDVTIFDLLLLRPWPSLKIVHHTLLLIFFTYVP